METKHEAGEPEPTDQALQDTPESHACPRCGGELWELHDGTVVCSRHPWEHRWTWGFLTREGDDRIKPRPPELEDRSASCRLETPPAYVPRAKAHPSWAKAKRRLANCWDVREETAEDGSVRRVAVWAGPTWGGQAVLNGNGKSKPQSNGKPNRPPAGKKLGLPTPQLVAYAILRTLAKSERAKAFPAAGLGPYCPTNVFLRALEAKGLA
jgi:uncharacterized Zn finger protein (UPF0148 family)